MVWDPRPLCSDVAAARIGWSAQQLHSPRARISQHPSLPHLVVASRRHISSARIMFANGLLRLSLIYQTSFLRLTAPAWAPIVIMTSQSRPSSSGPGRPLVPRRFPSSGLETIDASVKVEEETLPCYDPKLFYPVHIGEVFRNRYQVTAKLGYGTDSTTWLCHDLL